MELNKKKSGIVIFAPRRAQKIPYMKLEISKDGKKEWKATSDDIGGVPILSKYKYLGTILDCKLTMQTQLEFIRKKSGYLFTRLYPYLSNASADGRRDMWRTMVCPLFQGALIHLSTEDSQSHISNFCRLWIYTFKQFMMIPKTTKTSLVEEMIGIDLAEWMKVNAFNSAQKWEARKTRQSQNLLTLSKKENYLKGIPNEWCMILKQQCSLCHICKDSTRNANHMEEKHDTQILPYQMIWESIKEVFIEKNKQFQKKNKNKILKIKRGVFLEIWRPRLVKYKEETDKVFQRIYYYYYYSQMVYIQHTSDPPYWCI